jgi:adenylate cyclase
MICRSLSLIFFFSLELTFSDCCSQSIHLIDSLQRILKAAKDDTTRIKTINAIAWEISIGKPDSAILLSKEALHLAEKIKWEKGIGKSCVQLGSFNCIKGNFPQAIPFYQRALEVWERLERNVDGKERREIKDRISSTLGNLGNVFRNQGNYPQARNFYLRALKINRETGNKVDESNNLGRLGNVYLSEGDYLQGIDYYSQALKMKEEQGDKNGIAIQVGNMGLAYWYQGNYPKALEYFFRALRLDEEVGNKINTTKDLGNIGSVYHQQGDYLKALNYYHKALKIDEELGAKSDISSCLANIGLAYAGQGDQGMLKRDTNDAKGNYSLALDYYFKALAMAGEAGEKNSIATISSYIGMCYYHQNDAANGLKYLTKALETAIEIGDKNGIALNMGNLGELYSKTKRYSEAEAYLLKALTRSDSLGTLNFKKQFELSLSDLYEQTGKNKFALEHYKKAMEAKDSLFNEEKDKEITRKEMNYEFGKKEAANKAEQDKKEALSLRELEKQKLLRNGFVGGFGVVLLFAGMFFTQRNIIRKGKKLSDELLLNILPAEVAEELKNKGAADAKLFDDVTVLFTDFKSFTIVSERLSPQQLVDELHACFSVFDEICGKYNIEKIKTVGDAYLAVSGLPLANSSHALDVIKAGIEIREFTKKRKQILEDSTFDIRIGVHSGSVVAGIVGVKKFAYDIWGDTVNTAARMEQNSEAGKINISETTYELVKNSFNCEYRGEIEAKNKGKLKMYFVEQEVLLT